VNAETLGLPTDTQLSAIIRLADRLHRRQLNNRPIVLALGSDVLPMAAIEEEILARGEPDMGQSEFNKLTPEQRRVRVPRAWQRLQREEKDQDDLFENVFAAASDAGYAHVARLAARGYFHTILTTDYSKRLEDALSANGVPPSAYATLVNGVLSGDQMQARVKRARPPLKIVKLYGNLHGDIAFTDEEAQEAIAQVRPVLESYLARTFLVYGYNATRDKWPVDESSDSPIYYAAGTDGPPRGSQIARAIATANRDEIVVAPIAFDTFFGTLNEILTLLENWHDQKVQIEQRNLEEIVAHALAGRAVNETLRDIREREQPESAPRSSRTVTAARTTQSATSIGDAPGAKIAPSIPPPIAAAPTNSDLIEIIANLDRPEAETEAELPAEPLVPPAAPTSATSDTTTELFEFVSEPTQFVIALDENRQLTFNITGPTTQYTAEKPAETAIDLMELNEDMLDLVDAFGQFYGSSPGGRSPARRVLRLGAELYEALFAPNADFNTRLASTRQIAGDDELYLAFAGPRHLLGIPYELLQEDGKPLILRHPLVRHLSDTTIAPRPADFKGTLDALNANRLPLRVLLVATTDETVAAAEEVARHLKDTAEELAVAAMEVRIISPREATLENIRELLDTCPYHIVHFFAASQVNSDDAEDTGLRLTARSGGLSGGGPGESLLTARELAQRLRPEGTQTLLLYLDAQSGIALGGRELLERYDYLGLIDAAADGGVPNVLGYRWPVRAESAQRFATQFYEHLFRKRSIVAAVHCARRAVFENDAYPDAAYAPLLVAQPMAISA
jgi:CHAT domain-containing protein/sulfur carrier protein ThiS